MLKMMQDMQTALVDCAGFCQFSMSGQPPPLLFPQLATATGVNYTFPEIVFNGERIWNLQKLFNLKADIGETINLYRSKPAQAAELRAKLMAWLKSTDAQFPRLYADIPAAELPGRKRSARAP